MKGEVLRLVQISSFHQCFLSLMLLQFELPILCFHGINFPLQTKLVIDGLWL